MCISPNWMDGSGWMDLDGWFRDEINEIRERGRRRGRGPAEES